MMNRTQTNVAPTSRKSPPPNGKKTKMQQIGGQIKEYLSEMDWIIISVSFVLAGFGLLLIYSATRFEFGSASSPFLNRYITVQLAAIAIGITGMIILSCVIFLVRLYIEKRKQKNMPDIPPDVPPELGSNTLKND